VEQESELPARVLAFLSLPTQPAAQEQQVLRELPSLSEREASQLQAQGLPLASPVLGPLLRVLQVSRASAE